MHWSLYLQVLIASTVLVAASPMASQAEVFATATTTSSGAEPTFTVVKRRETHNCNQDPDLKRIEAQAWADAGAMAEIANEYEEDNDWQPAMDYWMGADSTKSENYWKIKAALSNERAIHHPNWVFPEAVVDTYCGDTHPKKKKICKLQKNPNDPDGPLVTQFASSWVERGFWYNTYNIVFCPRFFKEKKSLESILHDMKDGTRDASNASEYKLSWGHTYYHELMHLDPVIAAEEVWDVAYYACPVAKLANQNGCSYSPIAWWPPNWDKSRGDPHSLINADSWAFFASGVYFQKAMSLKKPGSAINNCRIYSNDAIDSSANYTLDNGTWPYVEGILLESENRTDGTYDFQVPPNPPPENTPPDDPPTPALPYTLSDLPSGLATPFDADAYFATYTPTSSSTSTAPTQSTTSVAPPPSTTAPPPPPSSAPPPPPPPLPPPPSPSMDSAACKDCTNNLGASDCKASDDTCLVNQCKADKSCQACGIDCSKE